jgi:arylsulfatase A-like enzyme
MPNLDALSKRGVIYTNHHSVYPTVTRVNSSSISTGAYPQRHGILGNAVFFPRVDPERFLDTGQKANLERIQADQDGVLLTAATLGEILHAHGRTMLAVGAGTSGSTFLLNHTTAGGAILHTEFAAPEALYKRMLDELGPVPADGKPNDQRNHRAVDALLKIGIPAVNPSVTASLAERPDTTAHALGMGHPTTIEALKRLDGEIKNILDGLTAAKLLDQYNIWVTSDHGFATYVGGADLRALLKPLTGKLPDGSPDVVLGDTAIYVRDGDQQKAAAIVRELQRTAEVGAIFTAAAAPGSTTGWAEGTLSFDLVRWNHPRAGTVLYSPDWTDARNQFGIAGTSASNGVAGHGSSSPFEIHNTLIAAGPDIKRGGVVSVPSANVDFAPTFLHMLGLPIPASIQGRPLLEALLAEDSTRRPSVRTTRVSAATQDGAYSQVASVSIVTTASGEYQYLDSVKATRRPSKEVK